MKTKMIKTMPAAILLLALYFIIFNFSTQTGEESASVSREISVFCVELMESISGRNWNQEFSAKMVEYFEHPIRKLAHFSEYAIMGMLVWYILNQWVQNRVVGWKLALLWIFVSACADEIYQLFVPDRYGSFADVILDTSGGMFGIFLCSLFLKLIHKNFFCKNPDY